MEVSARLATPDDTELTKSSRSYSLRGPLKRVSEKDFNQRYQDILAGMEARGLTDGQTISPSAVTINGSRIEYIMGVSSCGRHLAGVAMFKERVCPRFG